MTLLLPNPPAAPAREPALGARAPSARPAVGVRGLGIVYPGGTHALRSVDLDVARGSHLAILGASGSGKTTLLGCLSGRIDSRLATTTGSIELPGGGVVATIHQDLRLVKQRCVLANVLDGASRRVGLGRSILRFPREERDRAWRLLTRVGLRDKARRRVATLSGGEQQRVAIARALMQQPDLLLADEPVASLDAGNARSIMRLLCELQREHGLTLISVLHDCELAETFADRIIGFADGRIVYDQTARHDESGRRLPCGGLRGFPRFDPCNACHTIGISAAANGTAQPVNASVAVNGRMLLDAPAVPGTNSMAMGQGEPPRSWSLSPRSGIYALVALAILALYAWSLKAIPIDGRELGAAWAPLAGFVKELVPTGSEWSAIPWGTLLSSLVVTFQMALLGTTIGIAISWPLAALAAGNVAPWPIRATVRFGLNALRSVPSIVWALLFVAAVGLGELAGLLALVMYSIGYLTKFYYEAFEAVEPGPPEALRELGAGGLTRFLRGIWPAGRAAILSASLFMLEYNVRAASVLGIVGAGGIGFDLRESIDWRNFHVTGAILLMLIAVVLVLDAISSRARAWLMKP